MAKGEHRYNQKAVEKRLTYEERHSFTSEEEEKLILQSEGCKEAGPMTRVQCVCVHGCLTIIDVILIITSNSPFIAFLKGGRAKYKKEKRLL